MEPIFSLPKQLKKDSAAYPHLARLTFAESGNFSWNHASRIVTFSRHTPFATMYLLHEYAHAVLDHKDFDYDIKLLELERDAWDAAAALAPKYSVSIDTELIEQSLDTYRDWLHARSLCPTCYSTGLQTGTLDYACTACGQSWAVNPARTCGLKRYKKNNPA